MPRFDVTIAGELNLDLILYGLPDELPPERELLADRMMLTLGSSSAIAARPGVLTRPQPFPNVRSLMKERTRSRVTEASTFV